jgi:hypothetical protein
MYKRGDRSAVAWGDLLDNPSFRAAQPKGPDVHIFRLQLRYFYNWIEERLCVYSDEQRSSRRRKLANAALSSLHYLLPCVAILAIFVRILSARHKYYYYENFRV